MSCHTTQAALAFAQRQFPDLYARVDPQGSVFTSARDLENRSPLREHTRNLRAFGYFGGEVAISQRVINESASVAAAMSAR